MEECAMLIPGVYRQSVSGLVTTWDVRLKVPNKGDYVSPKAMHTIEHTLAYYLREKYGYHRVLGVYPIGSLTGLCVMTRFISKKSIYEAILEYAESLTLLFSVPGASEESCGNYDFHDLIEAKRVILDYRYKWLPLQNEALDYIL